MHADLRTTGCSVCWPGFCRGWYTIGFYHVVVQNKFPTNSKPFFAPENFEKIKLGSEVKVVFPGNLRGVKAIVEEMPTTSQSTPGGLGSRMLVSPRSVRVYLTLKESLPEERIVDGLPVKVEWGLRSFF